MKIDRADFAFSQWRHSMPFAVRIGVGKVEPQMIAQHEPGHWLWKDDRSLGS